MYIATRRARLDAREAGFLVFYRKSSSHDTGLIAINVVLTKNVRFL